LCIPWKRIYEVVRHYDLPSLMVAFDAVLLKHPSVKPPEYYGIERVEDGIAYRLLGGRRSLKLLYPVPIEYTPQLLTHNIEPTVTSRAMLRALADAIPDNARPLGVHLWLNVGYRTTGIATTDELIAALDDLARSKTKTKIPALLCKSIGTKYPYEKGITTFADFYQHKATDLRAAIAAPTSMHTKCSGTFRELLRSCLSSLPTSPVRIHSATSFEVYAGAVDDFTDMITVGNLFYYGFKPTPCIWKLEVQQVAQLPKHHCLDNACDPETKVPMQVVTLFNRIPIDCVYLVFPASRGKRSRAASYRLGLITADLNYGKIVVRLPKSCVLTDGAFFEARRTFF